MALNLVGKRVYSLSFLRVKDIELPLASEIAKKFFSSFELKPPGKQ